MRGPESNVTQARVPVCQCTMTPVKAATCPMRTQPVHCQMACRFGFDPFAAALCILIQHLMSNRLGATSTQGQKMVGLGAPDELIEEVNTVTQEHHVAMQVGAAAYVAL